PIRQRPALEELVLGLVVVLLGVGVLDDLVEFDDMRLLFLDPQRGRADVDRRGREGPDGDRDHGDDTGAEDGPATAVQDVPEVPEVDALFLAGVRIPAGARGRRRAGWLARDQLDGGRAWGEGARVFELLRAGHWMGTAAPTPKCKKSRIA